MRGILESVGPMIVSLVMGAAGASAASPDHDGFDALLGKYVVDERYVDYDAWSKSAEDRTQLQDYLDRLQRVEVSDLDSDSALAYWINLYNAATLDLVLDHHPVESIKDIGSLFTSAWERELVEVEGRALTLDEIENEIIRPQFEDPRIHFALNCAAISCPPLAGEAYRGERLDEQLEEATARAVHDPQWVDLSRCESSGEGSIRLSKIFDWYDDDFGGEEGIRRFLAGYRPEAKLPLQNERCSLDYLDYDWGLNRPPSNPTPE